MITVKIELNSAITGKTTEIGRMYIANDGTGSAERGDYKVAVCRRGTTAVPRELFNASETDLAYKAPKAQRAGEVHGYPRLAYSVWRLIARAVHSAFPEEAKRAKRDELHMLDAEVMRGLQLLREHFDNDGHDWHNDPTWEQCIDAAEAWLDAAKVDPADLVMTFGDKVIEPVPAEMVTFDPTKESVLRGLKLLAEHAETSGYTGMLSDTYPRESDDVNTAIEFIKHST